MEFGGARQPSTGNRHPRTARPYNEEMQRGTFKLVETCVGTGELVERDAILGRVRYDLQRFQGMLEGSGMPIPGLHRIEGSIDYTVAETDARLVGAPLTLRLEDGRSLAITLADRDGRVLAEGHGPSGGCSCC